MVRHQKAFNNLSTTYIVHPTTALQPLYSGRLYSGFYSKKAAVERSTALTPCHAPTVALQRLYSALQSTALQRSTIYSLYTPPQRLPLRPACTALCATSV